jgi:hypothetical protein
MIMVEENYHLLPKWNMKELKGIVIAQQLI